MQRQSNNDFLAGEYILPRQAPSTTTTASRNSPFELLIAIKGILLSHTVCSKIVAPAKIMAPPSPILLISSHRQNLFPI
jgi:hypothetical protein